MALLIFQHQQLQFDLEVRCVMVFFEASCSCELCRSASFAFSFCVSAHSIQRRFFRADKTLIVVKVWFAEEIFSFVQLAPSQSCRLGATLVNFRFRMRDRVSDICRFDCAHINVGFGSWIWSGICPRVATWRYGSNRMIEGLKAFLEGVTSVWDSVCFVTRRNF